MCCVLRSYQEENSLKREIGKHLYFSQKIIYKNILGMDVYPYCFVVY